MLAPFSFALVTWRECVVGVKPTESVSMSLDRTWEVPPKFTARGVVPGAVRSDSLGTVAWRIREDTPFAKPCRVLRSEAYDAKRDERSVEEAWVAPNGDIVRQWELRTSARGTETADAAFAVDHIDLTRVDVRGKTTYGEVLLADGMAPVQRRFKPMDGPRKDFLRLDGLAGTFRKVVVERAGRFRGTWGGEAYAGIAYRFTVDGVEQTAMLTPQDELVQIDFSEEVRLVLREATKSKRRGGG